MKILKFIIPGKPIVQARARVMRSGWAIDPTAKAKRRIGLVALQSRLANALPVFTGDCVLKVDIWGLRSNSDLDNAIKAYSDACNKILYEDDRQIYKIIAERHPKDGNDRTEIEVIEV